jgi:hypothetical protein
MVTPMVAAPPCAACGARSARIELVPPGTLPAEWHLWSDRHRETFARYRDPGRWCLLVEGIAAGNGWAGDTLDAGGAARIAAAFRKPWTYTRVHQAGFYDDAGFCAQCDAPYCFQHWHVSAIGYGHCPAGHGKSLDPHWSPDDS